ncbi:MULTISPECIES: GNAT family N-acetyltransferase [unclassified Streptomyces]|uniref:GNAT family N-acetyltransferase n=1 Tax=Streptomyces sp. NBC_00060 TaxID=2975636 RepID=A0AAU2HF57_9ACTN
MFDEGGAGKAFSRAWALSGARVDLEPLRVEHAEEMAEVLGDPALHRFIGGVPDDVEQLRARYARMTAGSPDPAVHWLNWVIRLREEHHLVGTVQATVEGGTAEIAWVVGTPWQGRGIAVEAARALVAGLAAYGVRRVVAHIHPDHTASAAVARAAGLAPTDEWQDGEVRWRAELAG